MKKILYLLIPISSIVYSLEYYYQNDQKVYLTKVDQKFRSDSTHQHYIDENNISLTLNNEIIIELDKKKITIDQLIKKYPIQVSKKIGNRFYLCRVKNRSQTFDLAAKIYHEEGVDSSHPNFRKQKFLR
ncbi:MAG: hypothetical protein U9N49_06835 [Campylobacterota bacterium]|nr:hypothetical protein [Campylobacterota bacterium]